MSPVFQQVFVGALVAFGCSLLGTQAVRNVARRYGLFDPCDDRKLHKIPVPRVGGVAIVLAVVIAIAIDVMILGGFRSWSLPLAAVLLGGLSMHVLGLIDDVITIRARYKLVTELVIAAVATATGLAVETVAIPGFGTVTLGPVFGFFFAVIWLVGVTNAFNLIDGVDGLAAGVAAFALGTFVIAALLGAELELATVAAILVGAAFGFLRFNTFPATIFLGDSGSLFLGFLLAGLGLLIARTNSGAYEMMVPVVALAVPIMDTGLTIVRRFLRRQPIFVPDRGHVHHRLLARGYSPSRVAYLLYGASAVASMAAVLLAIQADRFFVIALFAMLGLAVFVHELRFHEFQELARLIRRGVSPRRVIGRNVRFREASVWLAEVESGRDIPATLDRVFSSDPIRKVELRLSRDFLSRHLHVVHDNGRADDELPVWTRLRSESASAGSWEVSLPLLGPDERRIGALVLWEDEALDAGSVSHLQVIAQYLRVELERKLCALGWPVDETPLEVAPAGQGSAIHGVPIPTTQQSVSGGG